MNNRANGDQQKKIVERRLKILFLTPRFPWPLIGGDRIKCYHLLKHLARRHEVKLVTFSINGKISSEQRNAVNDLGVELRTAPINPLLAGVRSFSALFNGLPLEIAFYTQPQFARIVDELCIANDFDLGVSFFMRSAEYIRKREFKKLLIAEDCRLMYQSRSSEASKSMKQRLIRQWETRRLSVYEPKAISDFNCTTLVTNEDIAAMRGQNPTANYALLTNGVELDVYTPNFDMKTRSGVLFGGKLDVWANEQMALSIARDIMPQARIEAPDTKLIIVGANPSVAVKRLAGNGVEIHANVPSFTPYLQSARLFLHPHKGASGIQNKVLQAMACGCPVVTTPTGIQGVAARHGEEVMIAETRDELVKYVVQLLREPELAGRLAANARKVVEKNHSWGAIDSALDGILESIFPELNAQIKSSEKIIVRT